jgi:hypothetical protein
VISGVAPAAPGIETLEPDSAACSRASCSGERDERITRPRNCDSSFSTFSGCTLRISTNRAEVLGCRVSAAERMNSSSMP